MNNYESYKDSGVEWIGKIPTHWKISAIKYTSEVVNGSTPKSGINEYWNGNIYWITTDDLGKLEGKLISDSKRKISEAGLKSCGTKMVPEGSVILSTRAPIGHLGILSMSACTNQGCKSIVPKNINNKFLYYILMLSKEQLQALGQGSTFQELTTAALKQFNIVHPPVVEQSSIANYLDQKTSEIDKLISKKEQLINLLEEEKTAVINHAINKGLNPDVPMKDSGVEWLGHIPEHWDCVRLKNLVKEPLKYGANESANDDNPNNPRYIRITDFGSDGNLKEDTFKSLPVNVAKDYMLEEGDLLFARSGATVGKTFLFKNYIGKACFAGYLIKASFNPVRVNSTFIDYVTRSNYYKNWKQSIFQQATIQNIGADKYNLFKIPIPSGINEQNQIVSYLRTKTEAINLLITKYKEEISYLKEYKTALISEVVTGKVDVREELLVN